MEIYTGTIGSPLQWLFTFIIPVLVVVNVPARLLAKPLDAQNWSLALFAVAAAAGSLWAARWIFSRAMKSYRSASS
jgi:ABC-2 type transport system permease protein